MFHVVALDTEAPITDFRGEPIVFANGQEAAQHARDWTERTGKKHQPRPIASDDWKARERGRMERGEYNPVPWHNETWWLASTAAHEHYAHVSTDKSGMVAFTEDAAKGAADRQTRVKPGVYLNRYFESELDAEYIQRTARAFAGEYEEHVLQFATTADDIERVYVTGPISCMSGKPAGYNSPFHPVRVYAAGDLAVAYLTNGGRITARALCRPERKAYGRVYGDEHRLCALLEKAGFKADYRALRGAKLTRHECDRGALVCPYIDNIYRVDDCGDYLRIGGDIIADSTSGLIRCEPEGEYCPHCCENGHDGDDMCYLDDVEESWCSNCIDNDAVRAEPNGHLYGDRDNVVAMANGEYWETRYFERHGGTCEATDENYPLDDLVVLVDGTVWCRDYFERNGFQCDECGDNFDNDDMSATDDCCKSCHVEDDDAPPRDSRGRYKARQGRDEHPDQLELKEAS